MSAASVLSSLQDEQLIASIEEEQAALNVDKQSGEQDKSDEDERLMAAIEEDEALLPKTEAHGQTTDVLVAAELAVAAPLTPITRFEHDVDKTKDGHAAQHIGVESPAYTCLDSITEVLETTADEHIRRHNAYTRARMRKLSRWASIRQARLGNLVVLPGLWCLMGVLTVGLVHSEGSTEILVAVWGSAGLVALVLLSLRVWRARAAVVAAQPVSANIPTRRKQEPRLAFSTLWLYTWSYAVLLFLVPATAMIETNDYGAQAGAYVFLAALWFAGWGHHFFSRVKAPEVEDVALMPTIPDGLTFRLRAVAVIYEGYVACGFSFFPALPWKKTSVPKPIVHFFEAASFEFGLDTHMASFLTACATVPVAFAVLVAVKRWGGAEQFLMVVDLFFESLMFPVCKQLIGVLSCTRGDLRETTTEFVEGNTTTFTTKRICGYSVPFDASCMDGRPDVSCWSGVHLWYILAVFLFLVPYYLGGVQLRTDAQRRTSTVVIDGLFSILAFQTKFLLAVISSGFGDCHPWVVLISVEVSVIGMLVITARRNFSNVLQLTALRVGGLVAASLNCFIAAYVAWRLAPDSCAKIDDTVHVLENMLLDEHGSRRVIVMVREIRDSDGGLVNSTTVPAGTQPLHQMDASARQQLDLVQDYSTFIALVSVNAFVVLATVIWYYRASAKLKIRWENMEEAKRIALSQRVDYPIIRKRLLGLPSITKKLIRAKIKGATAAASARNSKLVNLARATSEQDSVSESDVANQGFVVCASEALPGARPTARAAGKQLEDLTIELLLFKDTRKTRFLKRDPRVFFFGLDIRCSGCERLMRALKKVLEDSLAQDSGCLSKVTCGCFAGKQIAAGRTVGVQFAAKPLGVGKPKRWAEDVEERLCFLGQIPGLSVIDLRSTGYSLELLALGACDPVGRKQLTPVTLSYVMAGTSIEGSRNRSTTNLLKASGKEMGYDMIPRTVPSRPSSLDTLVVDFMNPSAKAPAIIGTPRKADRDTRPFAQIYSEFCDLFAEGCLRWKVDISSKLSVFAKIEFDTTQGVETSGLNEWIAKTMGLDKANVVNPTFVDRRHMNKRVRWSLCFQIRQPTIHPTSWNTTSPFESATVLSNFIKGFLQSDAIENDHRIDSANAIANAWRARQQRRRPDGDTKQKHAVRSRNLTLQGTAASAMAVVGVQHSANNTQGMGKNTEEDAIIEKERDRRIRHRAFSRTDKLKALRQMIARRVPGPQVKSFATFEKRAGQVVDLTFTSVDVRSKGIGPWHVALIAAWASHHPQVTELLLGNNKCIGNVAKPDLHLDPWYRAVKRLALDAKIRNLDISAVGMGPAGLLVLAQCGLLETLASLNLGSNPIIGDGAYEEKQRIAKVSEWSHHRNSDDVWTTFCEAVCRSNIAVLNLSNTGLVPHSLSSFSNSLHRNAELIAQRGALGTMILADNDLTAEGDQSGLAIFLVSASSVETLDISATGLGPGCAETISHELSEMMNLTSLNISGNDFGVAGAALMAHKLQQHSQDLKLLLLGRADKPTSIPINQQPQKLDWRRQGLGPADAVLFSALLPTVAVSKINLCGNELGYVGKVAVATALRNWGPHDDCPIEQLQIDLGRKENGSADIKISQKAVILNDRDLSLQDLHVIGAFLARQLEVDTLDLSENVNLLRPRADDIEQWGTLHKALCRTMTGKKYDYHLCEPLFEKNREFLWNDHDLESWSAYTKQLLGDADEAVETGCRSTGSPTTEHGKDVVQHTWWRLCQAIRKLPSCIVDLRLSNVGLTPKLLAMLADGFGGGTYELEEMRTIDLHKNSGLTGPRIAEQTGELHEFLSMFGIIAELNVSGCDLGNNGAQTIGKHLHKISKLNIVNNPDIGVKGAASVADSVITSDEKKCKVRLRLPGADDGSLVPQHLSLFDSYPGADSKPRMNRTLARLGLVDDPIRLQEIKLGVEGIGMSVGEVSNIPFYSDISKLVLARRGLRDADAVIVAAALSTLRKIGTLDIQGNRFGASGKEALAGVIQNLGSLHTLIIDIGGHEPAKHQASTSEDDDDISLPELRANTHPNNPCFVFGGEQERQRNIDLSYMDLRAEDLLIVGAWIKAPLSMVSELDLSHNDMMLSCKSTADASGRSVTVSHSFVHEAWSKLCHAIKRSNITGLVLQNVGLRAEKAGQYQWCIDPLVRVLERTATLQHLDISNNFVLQDPYNEYFDPSDQEKLQWEHAAIAKKAIAAAMIRRSEGWLQSYKPLEIGCTPAESTDVASCDVKHFAESQIAAAFNQLQQDREGDQQTVEYKHSSKPAFKPLHELLIDMGAPSTEQSLATTYAYLYKKGIGKVYDVQAHQELEFTECSLRADDAELLAALITVWDNSRAVSMVRLSAERNMLGQLGRKLLIDAFTRGPRSTFTEGAKLIIDVGRWQNEDRGVDKKSVPFQLEVPVVGKTAIRWAKGLGQKQLAILSAWLREAVAHKKSRVREINLSGNPHLGWWDLKEALIDLATSRDRRQDRKSLGRLPLAKLNSVVYDREGLDAMEIEAQFVKSVPVLEQMPSNLRHGLDRALTMLSQCEASARKVEVLKLSSCGLNLPRLSALAEAIRPDQTQFSQGFEKLSELHLDDNPSLVATATIESCQPWAHLCEAIAQRAHYHRLRYVSLSGCLLSAACAGVLATRLTEQIDSKSKGKRRLHTLNLSNNDVLGSKGGKVVAEALVVGDYNWPVEEIVVGHDDRTFLSKQQGSSMSSKRAGTKNSRGDPHSDDELEQEIEREVSNTLPLDKQSQMLKKHLFRPLIEGKQESVQGCVLSLECKGLAPGFAWILGEWLVTRDKTFGGLSEYADMMICSVKLKGNPLTGSKINSSSGMSLRKRKKQSVSAGMEMTWTEGGGVIDEDPLGFGKLCESFALPNVTDVDISYCGLGAQAMHEMTKSEHNVDDVPWLRHAQLRSLNLSHNPIGVEGRRHLKKALCDADIHHLVIDIGGKPKLLDAALPTLDFSQTHDLTAEDTIVLAGWITATPVKATLEQLDISDNDLFNDNSDGFADLMEAVPKSGISTLKMANVSLHSDGLILVAHMIANSKSVRDPKDRPLSTLSLSGNSSAVKQQRAFREFCASIQKSTLQSLDLSDMQLSAELVDRFLRPAFEEKHINPAQIKQVMMTGNPACQSNQVMQDFVKTNRALQHKLVYRDEHKLALNDMSKVESRYQNWLAQQPQGRLRKEDAQLKAEFADLPTDPYQKRGRHQTANVQGEKRMLSRTKSGPVGKINSGARVMALGKTVSNPSIVEGSAGPLAISKLGATKTKTRAQRPQLKRAKSGEAFSSAAKTQSKSESRASPTGTVQGILKAGSSGSTATLRQ